MKSWWVIRCSSVLPKKKKNSDVKRWLLLSYVLLIMTKVVNMKDCFCKMFSGVLRVSIVPLFKIKITLVKNESWCGYKLVAILSSCISTKVLSCWRNLRYLITLYISSNSIFRFYFKWQFLPLIKLLKWKAKQVDNGS